jgi:hypothetical protein
MVHQEAADKSFIVPEAVHHQVVGTQQEPCIFYAAGAKNYRCGWEHPATPVYSSELHGLEGSTRLGSVYSDRSRIGNDSDIWLEFSFEPTREPDRIVIDRVTTVLPKHWEQLAWIRTDFRLAMT